MIGPHIDVEPSRSWDPLELSRWSRCSSEVVETPNHLEHGSQGHPTRFPAKTSMWAKAVMKVAFHRPVDPYSVGFGEELGFPVGINEANKNLVTGIQSDWSTSVVDSCLDSGFAVGAKGAVESDAFHRVVEEFIISLHRVQFGKAIDFWKMDLPLLCKIVIQQLRKLGRVSGGDKGSVERMIIPLRPDSLPWLRP